MKRKEQEELMTIAEFSRRTGLTESAIRNNIYQGRWLEKKQYVRKGKSNSRRKCVLIKYDSALAWYNSESYILRFLRDLNVPC